MCEEDIREIARSSAKILSSDVVSARNVAGKSPWYLKMYNSPSCRTIGASTLGLIYSLGRKIWDIDMHGISRPGGIIFVILIEDGQCLVLNCALRLSARTPQRELRDITVQREYSGKDMLLELGLRHGPVIVENYVL